MSMVNDASATDVLSQYRLSAEPKRSNDLGKNEFMELMLAQLNNQNPLEPQDNGDFIAQLAQFSSLEEMQKVTKAVENVAAQFRSTQALQASAMVGRTVLAPTDVGNLGAEGGIEGVIDVPASTSGLRLSVHNAAGELVRQIDLGQASPGQTKFVWDGKDGNGNELPPGRYELKANASYPEGSVRLDTLVSTNVDSVSLGSGGRITRNLSGLGSIALSEVRQIN